MTKTFLFVKRGGHLSLGSLPGRESGLILADPPNTFLSTLPGASMKINPAYKEVPFIQEKLKKLKFLIDCQKSTIALWEAEMPRYELLPKVKEELARNEKLLKGITGAQPCR